MAAISERTHLHEARAMPRDAVLAPWLFLGIGVGGLIDGIVFHQILQWHNMVSAVAPPGDVDTLRFNMLADGLFHGFAVLMTLLGLALLWRAVRTGRTAGASATGAFGGLLAGVGLFNLVEGIVNHHVLKLHNVREVADPTPYNLGFLLLGGVLPLALGVLLRQRAINAPLRARSDDLRVASPARVEPVAARVQHVVQLLLPLTIDGRGVEPQAYEAIKNELTARFGGLTAYTRSPAEGRWRGARTEFDDVVVFEVMTPDLDRAWWARYREFLERQFRQQAILVRAAPAQLL
jgi:uncharacterized membrane protein